MIKSKDVIKKWVKVQGTSATPSKESQESSVAVFLDGSVYLNPEKLLLIETAISNYRANKK